MILSEGKNEPKSDVLTRATNKNLCFFLFAIAWVEKKAKHFFFLKDISTSILQGHIWMENMIGGPRIVPEGGLIMNIIKYSTELLLHRWANFKSPSH